MRDRGFAVAECQVGPLRSCKLKVYRAGRYILVNSYRGTAARMQGIRTCTTLHCTALHHTHVTTFLRAYIGNILHSASTAPERPGTPVGIARDLRSGRTGALCLTNFVRLQCRTYSCQQQLTSPPHPCSS